MYMTGGIIQVYAKCPNCGLDGIKTRSIEKYAKKIDAAVSVTPVKSIGTGNNHPDYRAYLKKAKLKVGTSIVVFDGEEVMELKEWNLA